MFIGLTGENGAGKDTAASYLKEKGFFYHSLSDILREECQSVGVETNRDNLIEMGNKLRLRFGPGVLAKRTLEKIKSAGEEKSLVVSIRNLGEVEELKKEPSFKLVSVVAPVEIRYQRISSRGRPEDAVSFEKFKEQEARELAGSETEQQLKKVMETADFTVGNEGTVEELHRKIEEILQKIFVG